MFNHLNLIIMFVDTQKEHLDKLSYPLRVVELWCRNTRQLNPYRKPLLSDLISNPSCANRMGGFDWESSLQGREAWHEAIMKNDFRLVILRTPHLIDDYYIDFERYD